MVFSGRLERIGHLGQATGFLQPGRLPVKRLGRVRPTFLEHGDVAADLGNRRGQSRFGLLVQITARTFQKRVGAHRILALAGDPGAQHIGLTSHIVADLHRFQPVDGGFSTRPIPFQHLRLRG